MCVNPEILGGLQNLAWVSNTHWMDIQYAASNSLVSGIQQTSNRLWNALGVGPSEHPALPVLRFPGTRLDGHTAGVQRGLHGQVSCDSIAIRDVIYLFLSI